MAISGNKTTGTYYTSIKQKLNFDKYAESHFTKENNYGHWFIIFMVVSFLVASVYCQLSQGSMLGECINYSLIEDLLKICKRIIYLFLKASVTLQIFKALFVGVLVLFFTWGVIYFDSTKPGVQPPSPLSPQKVRSVSGHTFHTGYILAVINGLLCTVMFFIYSV